MKFEQQREMNVAIKGQPILPPQPNLVALAYWRTYLLFYFYLFIYIGV